MANEDESQVWIAFVELEASPGSNALGTNAAGAFCYGVGVARSAEEHVAGLRELAAADRLQVLSAVDVMPYLDFAVSHSPNEELAMLARVVLRSGSPYFSVFHVYPAEQPSP